MKAVVLSSEPSSRSALSVTGADGVGVVAEVDAGVGRYQIRDEVIILPSLWSGDVESHFGASFEILGDTTAGTLGEYVTVPAENVY